jgi:rSAM/selenodomain-associated transferase 1
MSENALVILARAPQLGQGKTRLAATIGAEATLALYEAFVTDLARRFNHNDTSDSQPDQSYTLHWAVTPGVADFIDAVSHLVPDVGNVFPQQGDDLNSRLLNAFRMTCTLGYQKTILIGTDAPQVSRNFITQASEALDQVDVVLGPAEDGGYYLIAMREAHDVFSTIPMSTSQVMHKTLERIAALNLTVEFLKPLTDVDDWFALLDLHHLLLEQPEIAPMTATCLRSLVPEAANNSRSIMTFPL